MKDFFKTAFASSIGVIIAFVILFSILIFSLIGLSLSSSSAYSPKKNTVFKLSLGSSIVENATANPFAKLFGEEQPLSLSDILKSIRIAKDNKNISGIYIESNLASASPATFEAIRRALEDFKESGKFVFAYADHYSNNDYYLCSVADSVFVNPLGNVALSGLVTQKIFYTGLAEKVGVEYYIFKVGTYKGAVEPYFLKKFSDENREQITSYMSSIWNNMTSAIAKSRNITPDSLSDFVNNGLFLNDAKLTVDYNLTDGLRYKHEVEASIKALIGLDHDDKLRTAGVDQMVSIKEKTKNHDDKIAILYAEGVITDSASSSPFGGTESSITEKVANQLNKIKKDDDIKAVVLRVNSPGGSAYVSEQIWKRVLELREIKPVVVSMGDYAASGGYYISCAADMIVAEKNTLTGSIGVFGRIPNATGLFEKVGLTTDVVKVSNYADLGDLTRPMREDEKALIQSSVERTYDLFLTRCADGRSMTKEEIDAIGQGRVWTGEQALAIGLVDKLGGIDTAIEEAAILAELDKYNVITYTGATDFFTELLEKQLDEIKLGVTKAFLGEDYELFKSIQQAKGVTGIQAIMPFELKESEAAKALR
jgi:signal peptide peptidase SppA, 67K type